MSTITLSFTGAVLSKYMPEERMKKVLRNLNCNTVVLSEYLPDNHVTLIDGDRFVATLNIKDRYD